MPTEAGSSNAEESTWSLEQCFNHLSVGPSEPPIFRTPFRPCFRTPLADAPSDCGPLESEQNPSAEVRRLTLKQCHVITRKFSTAVLGKGGYGTVYHGKWEVDGTATAVAVKRLHERGVSGQEQWLVSEGGSEGGYTPALWHVICAHMHALHTHVHTHACTHTHMHVVFSMHQQF